MFYRENGQFKTTYRADQQIFPITQDRIAIALILAVAFLAVPMLASDYLFRAILIPFLIFSLAALGVNILVGYCGQISLGSGAFMAVGAYGAYNFFVRIPGMPLIPALILGGLCATLFGILFGLPSLRVKGLYLAVATLAAQFFCRLDVPAHQVVHQRLALGLGVGVQPAGLRPADRDAPVQVPVLAWAFWWSSALLAKNLVRGAIGREWMAIRDMDVAAAVIGIRPMYAKLSAFAVSSFIIGVAGALWGFVYLGAWEPAAFSVDQSFRLLFMVIIGGMGSIMGSFFGAAFIVVLPIVLNQFLPLLRQPVRHGDFHRRHLARRADDFWRADRLVPDRRAAWPGQAVVDRQAEAAPLALPPLIFESPFTQTPALFRALTPGDVMKLRTIALATCLAAVGVTAFAQAKEQFFPGLPYRTGPYAPNGVPWANGYADYLKLVNARGGINGVKIILRRVRNRLRHRPRRGVLRAPEGQAWRRHGVPAAVHRHHLRADRKGPRRQDPADHRRLWPQRERRTALVFKWNFPLAGTYWLAADALIQHHRQEGRRPGQAQGQEDRAGLPRQPVSARNRSRCCRSAQACTASTLQLLPVTAPGVEQKATWLQVRQAKPDYVLLWGWGVMNSTALKEAQATGYPREKMYGVWWSGAEPDVKDVGEGAKGYNAVTMQHGAEPQSKVVKDILKNVHDKGQGTGPKDEVGQVLYMRGAMSAMLAVEGVRARPGALRQGQGHDRRAGALGLGKPEPDQKPSWTRWASPA